MTTTICRKTLQPCQTPGMCSPHDGCSTPMEDLASAIVSLRKERDSLRTEVDRLRKLFAECAEYLNINKYTSIGHSSILHRKMIDAAMEASQCTSTDTTGSTPEA